MIKNRRIPEYPLMAFDYAPYRMMKAVKSPWEINKDGFRAKPFEQYQRDNNKNFRIVFLGGSACLGYGRDTGPPLSTLLEQRLHSLGFLDIEVINLAQGGAVSGQELAILIQYGLKLNPQIVVSFNGANDLMHPAPFGDDEQPNLPYLNQSMRELWHNAKSPLTYILNTTSIGRVIKGLKRRLITAKNSVPIEDVVNSYTQTMEVTYRIVSSYGAEHMILLQPIITIDKPLSSEEQKYFKRKYDTPEKISRCHMLFETSTSLLRSYAERNAGMDFYDLRSAFKKEYDTIYMDSLHFANNKGYPRLLAVLEHDGFINKVIEIYEKWKQNNMLAGAR